MTTLYDSMHELVRLGTGLAAQNVIPDNDPGPSPRATYAELFFFDDRPRGYSNRQVIDANTVEYYTLRDVMCQVTLYRVEAHARANRLAGWFYTDEALEKENEFDITMRNVVVRSIPEPVQSEVETRALVEIALSYYYNVRVTEPRVSWSDIIINHNQFAPETVEVMDGT